MKIKLLILFFIFSFNQLISQSIPLSISSSDEMLKVLQLTGKISNNYSFCARPFYYNESLNQVKFLELVDSNFKYKSSLLFDANGKGNVNLMPIVVETKFNSDHPYGWNDGGMIMAKGLQTKLSSGVFAKYGLLSLQLLPELYYASNPAYNTTAGYGDNSRNSQTKFYLGQSSLKIDLASISLGVSSENLWWGPGQFSSLLMSNNAPGFLHFTFNSNSPIKTPIGLFEWQLIGGNLNEDTARAFENNFMKPYFPKNESRYFNGLVLSYQPKWLKGFFLGLTRSVQISNNDLTKIGGSFIKKYLSVLTNAQQVVNAGSDKIPDDGSISIFTRWVLPKHQTEFYLEYGYNDVKANLRDFTTNANHSAAYIVGFKKVFTLTNNNLIDLSGEITQMSQSTSSIVRNAGNWYTSGDVAQGYTYQNQILGAGSGLGNNVQTIQVKKIAGINYWGLKLQRIQQDPKGLEGPASNLGLRKIQWNDFSIGVLAQKNFNHFLINGEMQFVQSSNYGWQSGSAFNLFAMIKCSYYF